MPWEWRGGCTALFPFPLSLSGLFLSSLAPISPISLRVMTLSSLVVRPQFVCPRDCLPVCLCDCLTPARVPRSRNLFLITCTWKSVGWRMCWRGGGAALRGLRRGKGPSGGGGRRARWRGGVGRSNSRSCRMHVTASPVAATGERKKIAEHSIVLYILTIPASPGKHHLKNEARNGERGEEREGSEGRRDEGKKGRMEGRKKGRKDGRRERRKEGRLRSSSFSYFKCKLLTN